jgi:DNA-binding transcriptional regulator YiaG
MSSNDLTPESIRELRRLLGLNQQAFADLIGCTQAAVSRWEDGVRSPKGLYARAVRDLMAARPSTAAPADHRAAR